MSSHAATCVVCEQAVAVLYCHQDDAQLCASCDHQVHSANQLAAQHTRVPLSKPVSRCGAPELGASHGAADPNCMNQHEPTFSFEDDETFAVPDVDLPSVAQDESSPFNAKALLGKDCIPDDFYLNDIDPLWLDRLDVGMDRLPSDILDSLVPELPPPANSPPAAARAQAAPAPRPAPPVAPTREAPMARPMIMAPMRFLHNQRIVFAPHPAFAQPAPVKQELAIAAVDVDIDSYVPRTLLPMDPAVRAQLVASRQEKLQRFREKKRNRHFKKTIRYASRKVYAEVRPRIKGRFARKDEVAAMRAAGELPPL